MAFFLAPLALMLALLVSPTQAMRKQIPSGTVNAKPTKSLVANPAEEAGSALVQQNASQNKTPEQPAQEPFIPPETGRCCTKEGRDGNTITRWFYYMKQFEDGTRGAPESVYFCPSSWSKTDKYYCNGKEAHNKFNYKENTDWVMCCKKGESNRYKYFTGQRCTEKSYAYTTCTNYECAPDVINTDASEVTCEKGYNKIVNENTKYGCPNKRPSGFTNQDCSGYSRKCEHNYCVLNSIPAKGNDCSHKCPAGGLAPMVGGMRSPDNGAQSMVHYSSTLLLLVLAAFVFA